MENHYINDAKRKLEDNYEDDIVHKNIIGSTRGGGLKPSSRADHDLKSQNAARAKADYKPEVFFIG